MKASVEWIFGIIGSFFGAVLAFWGLRAAYFKYVEEHSTGKKAFEKFRKELDELIHKHNGLQSDYDDLLRRVTRTEKEIDANFDDIANLDKKLETIRKIQESKLL